VGATRLLILEPGRRDLHQKIILNINENDVLFALSNDPIAHQILQGGGGGGI
jgi:hypothetical protein